jgi:hypothetical protein
LPQKGTPNDLFEGSNNLFEATNDPFEAMNNLFEATNGALTGGRKRQSFAAGKARAVYKVRKGIRVFSVLCVLCDTFFNCLPSPNTGKMTEFQRNKPRIRRSQINNPAPGFLGVKPLRHE